MSTYGEPREPTEREWLEGLRYEDKFPEPEGCGGDGYHDIVDDFGGVIGPRPCTGCPDCTTGSRPAGEPTEASS
jgi:hypothetical protein